MVSTNKAVFLDRDGVLFDDTGLYYIYKPEDLRLCPGVIDALKLLSQKGYMLIVISNQGGIGKGLYTKAETDAAHQWLDQQLLAQGIKISAYYYCPHHPESSNCFCRKPSSLLIEKAIACYQIDITKSFFIGDSARDMEAAGKVGLHGIKTTTNQNLLQAVEFMFI